MAEVMRELLAKYRSEMEWNDQTTILILSQFIEQQSDNDDDFGDYLRQIAEIEEDE